MTQFDVYLFDFDGTLCDTRDSLVPVFQAGYAVVGRPVTAEEAERWMHLSLPESFADSGVDPSLYPVVLDTIIASLDLPESIAMIRSFPEATDVLRELLSQGKRIGIVSNNGSSHIRLVLRHLGIDLPFSCIVGSDMFHEGKPSPEPIEMALSLLGEEDRSRVCYVGDSLQDVECGHNAGITGILIDREKAHPTFDGLKIANLKELIL